MARECLLSQGLPMHQSLSATHLPLTGGWQNAGAELEREELDSARWGGDRLTTRRGVPCPLQLEANQVT